MLKRQPDGTFETLDTSKFQDSGDYYFCWKPPYINYKGYIQASDSFWTVLDVPQITRSSPSYRFNQKIEYFNLKKKCSENDQFSLFKGIID